MKPHPTIIVFCRWPEPGKVKTRLAAGIGDEAACRIYRACLERTLTVARRWADSCAGRVVVSTADAPDSRWAEWLGEGWDVRGQREGDLGARMLAALTSSLDEGCAFAMCVGSDLPGLTVGHLKRAARALRDADAVVGPADDGGYYLVGLEQEAPELFAGIDWGTEGVLAQTRSAAQRAGLRLAETEALGDVDTAEDLWGGAGPTSVVIPTLNEQAVVGECVREARLLGVAEVIVADGGSTDATVEHALAAGARVIDSAPGRGPQLNSGAREAGGETLWFIHADCRLTPLALWEMGRALRDEAVIGGAFELAIRPATPALRSLAFCANVRSRLCREPYGDQAVFVRRRVFDRIGGFPDWPVLEDVELARKMRRAGRIVTLRSPVFASARRWQEHGTFRTWLRMKRVKLGYHLGRSPERLARIYEPDRSPPA